MITFQKDSPQVLEKDIAGLQNWQEAFYKGLHLKGAEK